MNRRSLLRFLGGAAVAPVVTPAVIAALPAAIEPELYGRSPLMDALPDFRAEFNARLLASRDFIEPRRGYIVDADDIPRRFYG